MTGLVARVAAGTAGRDRVLDGVQAAALMAVVIGHSLAWHVTPAGTASNVLDVDNRLVVLTWLFQVLPLFFAAGAVANADSLERHGVSTGSTDGFLLRRSRRLLTPVLLYAAVWTVVLLPLATVTPLARDAGVFLAQLLWFAGVYLIVVGCVPLTARWRRRPWLTVAVWFGVVAVIDVLRITGAPEWVGWVNLLAVWGLLHQIGYALPALRRANRALLLAWAGAALAAAVGLSLLGPYSASLVTLGTDRELSNLAPPSVVLALYGTAQILLLAAAWPALERLLGRDGLWAAVALVGARAMGIYLWHIPLVAIAAGVSLLTRFSPAPLGPLWWTVHLAVVAVVVPAAWVVAGVAQRGERVLDRLPRVFGVPPIAAALLGGLVVLNLSVTGFGTWLGAGMLGLPSLAVVNLVLLWALWQATGSASISGPPRHPQPADPAARRPG